jgi:RNA polymerase sigma factor (sigma-70 family)
MIEPTLTMAGAPRHATRSLLRAPSPASGPRPLVPRDASAEVCAGGARDYALRMPPPPTPERASGPDPAPLDSTAVLLVRAQSGDSAAREALFARFLPVLRRWAHRRLPSGARALADTDDLVQVTLVRALNRIPELEPRQEGSLLAYLRRILLNAVREEIRRSASRGEHRELADDLPDARASVVDEVVGREKMELYERGLAALTEEQQEAVVLRVEFGYSHQQIAEAMGKPSADAARMTVVRALVQLAKAMGEDT